MSLQADKNGFFYSPEECVWSQAHLSAEEKMQVLTSWSILVGPGHELQPLPVGHWAWGGEVRRHVCSAASKGHLVLYVPLDMRARVTQRKLICAQTWATHWPFLTQTPHHSSWKISSDSNRPWLALSQTFSEAKQATQQGDPSLSREECGRVCCTRSG